MRDRLFVFLLPVFSLIFSVSQAQELFRMPVGTQSRVSSFENPGAGKGEGGRTNKTAKGAAFSNLKAGESKTLLDASGPGMIQRMWFTVNDRSARMLRSLHLQIFWDGSSQAAVDVPFGDFFGVGLGRTATFQSALFSNPEGRSFNCYIPMPFKKGARVILTNESQKNLDLLFYDIDFVKLAGVPTDMLYFHAYWNRQKTSALGEDFELLPAIRGKGRFLGVNVGVNTNPAYRNTWFGEGEVKMYIDGDTRNPTINGTGTEDYVGTGWGLGTFNNLYQGCTIADEPNLQYAFYRFHVPDPIYFYKDLKVTIQQIGGGAWDTVKALQKRGSLLQAISVSLDTGFIRLLDDPSALSLQDEGFPKGWVNFYRIDDYSATSYFYLDTPEHSLPALVGVDKRVD
jgi:hypothetical protein